MVSGSGNVAQYAALKLLEYGAVVLTMSDSTGYVYEPNGFTKEQIEQVGFVGQLGTVGFSFGV
jgi:glutamate dehydrogenase (NADP+)